MTRQPLTLIACLFLFMLSAAAHAQETPTADPSWCVSAWYPSSEHPDGAQTLLTNADIMNVVHPFWYTPAPDGSLIAVQGAEDAEQIAAWREAGLRVVPSIFASVADVIMTDEARAVHVDAIRALVQRMNYDGIDLDYEGFPLNSREPFSLFAEALAEVLHADGRLLYITVHPKTADVSPYEAATAQDWPRLTAAADVFNIMAYDYTSRVEPPGPIAPTPWVIDVLTYAASVTDLSRVRLGVPFYGYTWMRGRAPAVATTHESAVNLAQSFNVPIQRDEADQEAFIDFDPPALPRQVVYFADAAALRYKLQAVQQSFPTLGGIAIWGLGGEDPANWDVLRELRSSGCASAVN